MKIAILGAGFAGTFTAIHISRRLKGLAEITLVDVNNYHLFKPMLHEVATGSVEPGHILQPMRHIMKGRHFAFVRGMVQWIDTANRIIHLCVDCSVCPRQKGCPFEEFGLLLEDVDMDGIRDLTYDYLVIALGGSPNYYGIEGAREYALPFNGLDDAERIKKHVLHAFEFARRLRDAEKKRAFLTFAVVGAGPTGLELVSDLHDWVYGVLPSEFQEVRGEDIQLYLIEAGQDILPASPVKVRETARRLIAGKSISILTESPITRVGKDSLETKNGIIKTFTTIWTAGIKGNEVVRNAGLSLDPADRILVDEHLTAHDLDTVFAVGDCAAFIPQDSSQPLPQTGQVAVQQARYLVERIAALVMGRRIKPFRYRELGSALSTGEHQALAHLLGIFRLHGLIGWVAWKLTYLKHLLGIRLSIRSFLDWFFDITYDREATRHKF